VSDRQLNIFFFFATIFVFLLFSKGADHTRFYLAIVLSVLFVSAAFVFNWLTLDGATSAILFGVIALGLGGFLGAAVVLGFFVSSSLLSTNEEDAEGFFSIPFRRDGMQVWSNGFWFALWMILWFTTDSLVFLIGAVASMAFSTADTWGSEVGGHRVKGTTWQFGSFKKVDPGVDGGISVIGTIATLSGATIIGGIYWLFYQSSPIQYMLIIVIAGFIGSFVDSLVGTYLQGMKLNERFVSFSSGKIQTIDNNMTNWLSSGVTSVLAIVLFLLTS